jgi:hypothetical protein
MAVACLGNVAKHAQTCKHQWDQNSRHRLDPFMVITSNKTKSHFGQLIFKDPVGVATLRNQDYPDGEMLRHRKAKPLLK